MKKNGAGTASFVLGIIALVFTTILPLLFLTSSSATGLFVTLLTGALGWILGYGLAFIGLILGIVAMFKKNAKKVLGILGLVFNIVALVLPMVVLG